MGHWKHLFLFLAIGTAASGMPDRSPWIAHSQDALLQSGDVLGRALPSQSVTGTVVVFMKPGCPLANLYSSRLAELQERHPSFLFVGVVVASSDRADFVQKWVKQRSFPFKVIHDRGELSRHFEAHVSPEAFVLDATGEMVYRGKIDDQFEPGRPHLVSPAHPHLEDKLNALEKSQILSPSFTLAKGCQFSAKKISFNDQIAPLIYQKCTHCHRPHDIQSEIPLTNFQEIVDWAPTIVERITERYMPPWRAHHRFGEFANDVSLTVNEMWAFGQWVEQETPVEATPKEAPQSLTQSAWRIGKPDAVVGMLPENESYSVPKTGILPYQHFELTSPFDEDKWVVATEVRPGAPDVVHHINVFIIPPEKEGVLARILKRRGAAARLKARGQTVNPESIGRVLDLYGYKLEKRIWFLSDFNPAESVTRFPAGKGMLLKKGSRFLFEVHYTPNGYAEREDRSLLAFQFADAVPADWEVREPITRIGGRLGDIQIPPRSTKELTFDLPIFLDADLHSLKPHMHYRGKSFTAEVLLPDGSSKTILHLPQWDYDFQLPYLFQTPEFLPKGSTLRLKYAWDNTEKNANITKEQTERTSIFGFQTEDEMCMAFPTYTYRTGDPDEIAAAESQVTQAIMKQVSLPQVPTTEEPREE